MAKSDIEKLIEDQQELQSSSAPAGCRDYIKLAFTECDYGYTPKKGLFITTCVYNGNPYPEGHNSWKEFENENCGGNYEVTWDDAPEPEAPPSNPTSQPTTEPSQPSRPVLEPGVSERWDIITDGAPCNFNVNANSTGDNFTQSLPYSVYIMPVILYNGIESSTQLKLRQNGNDLDTWNDMYNEWMLKKTTYKSTILKNPPFPVAQHPDETGKVNVHFEGTNKDTIIVDIPEDENLNVSLLKNASNKHFLAYRNIDYNQNIADSNIVLWNHPLIEYFNNPRSATLNQPIVTNRYFYQIDYLDPKLLSHQFSSLYIKDYFSNFYEYQWEYLRLWKNDINQGFIIKPNNRPNYESIIISALHSQIYYNSLNPENITEIIKFPVWNANSSKTGNFVINNVENSLPLGVNEYQEFLRTNSASINTQKQIASQKLGIETQKIDVAGNRLTTETTLGVVGGVAGAIGGIASGARTGNFSGALKGGALAVGAGVRGYFGKQELGIRELEAGKVKSWVDETIASSLIDKSRLPNVNRIYTSNFWEMLQNPDAKSDNITFSSIDKEKQDRMNKFFNEYGYFINESDNLNQYLGSRYYFNYIQAKDVFNTINVRLSSPIKQLINNAFNEGLTIWHYRSQPFWNGVLCYKYQNWETKLFKE